MRYCDYLSSCFFPFTKKKQTCYLRPYFHCFFCKQMQQGIVYDVNCAMCLQTLYSKYSVHVKYVGFFFLVIDFNEFSVNWVLNKTFLASMYDFKHVNVLPLDLYCTGIWPYTYVDWFCFMKCDTCNKFILGSII